MNDQKLKAGEQFYGNIAGYIRRRVANAEDAKDITQDIFTKVAAGRFPENRDKMLPWLYAVARNAVADHYRKQSRYAAMPRDLDDSYADEAEDSSDIAACLTPLLQLMPEEDRALLAAVDMNDLPQVEYARNAKLPYATVKSRVQRARKRLKNLLLDCCEITLDARGMPSELDDGNGCC